MKKFLLRLFAGLGVFVAASVVLVLARQNRTFEAPYPALRASTDPALIERGRYLAYGPAHCGPCHGDAAHLREADEGAEVPLSGGKLLDTPLRPFTRRTSLRTPKTGIGRFATKKSHARYGTAWGPTGARSCPLCRSRTRVTRI